MNDWHPYLAYVQGSSVEVQIVFPPFQRIALKVTKYSALVIGSEIKLPKIPSPGIEASEVLTAGDDGS